MANFFLEGPVDSLRGAFRFRNFLWPGEPPPKYTRKQFGWFFPEGVGGAKGSNFLSQTTNGAALK
jgi:hypothetical protein